MLHQVSSRRRALESISSAIGSTVKSHSPTKTIPRPLVDGSRVACAKTLALGSMKQASDSPACL